MSVGSAEPEAIGWQGEVERACSRQGLHLTPLRRRVLAILAESSAPLGAYAIIEQLSRREGKRIAPPTVYRTLEFFLDHGFLHKIESRNAYAPCEHLGHAHHGRVAVVRKVRAERRNRRRGARPFAARNRSARWLCAASTNG